MVNNHCESHEIYDKMSDIGVIIAQNETWVLLGHPRGLPRAPWVNHNGPKVLKRRTFGAHLGVCSGSGFSCVLLFFVDLIFIDFWTPSSLRFAVPAMLFSCFSCFEKVIILGDFCPPKMSPNLHFPCFLPPCLFMFFCFPG